MITTVSKENFQTNAQIVCKKCRCPATFDIRCIKKNVLASGTYLQTWEAINSAN